MKSIMLAGAALLAFSTGATGIAIAQGAPDATAQPPATETMPADPNAGQPTGAVPADTGMAPASPGVPRDPAAPMGSPANPVTVGGNMTPPPATATDYPLCSRTVQDSCINPSEAPRSKAARRAR